VASGADEPELGN